MQSLLLKIWSLPWPDPARKVLRAAAGIHLLHRLVFPKYLVGVVGIIYNDRHQILLLKHTYRGRFPWGLPTGWLEKGEQPSSALHRELLEEAGFHARLQSVHDVYVSTEHAHVNIVYYGRFAGGSFTPNAEVSGADFFSLDDLPPLLPDQLKLIKESAQEEVFN